MSRCKITINKESSLVCIDDIQDNFFDILNTNCWIINNLKSCYTYVKKLWEQKNGPKPEKMFFRHKCKTPLCVNPDHYYLSVSIGNRIWEIRRKNKTDKFSNSSKEKLSNSHRIRSLKNIIKSDFIKVDSEQAKNWPEIANTQCWLRTHARRFYQTYVGKIPKDFEVCHKCDNIYGPCVNPEHLFLGTHKTNMRDCTNKKRNKKFDNDKIWNNRTPKEKSLNAKKGWETRRKTCQL